MFRDLNKKVTDLLFEDYIYGQNIQIKSKNSDNMKVQGDAEFSATKPPLMSITASCLGNLFSLDKFRVKSDGRVLAEFSLKTSNISKLTVMAEDGRNEPGRSLASYGKIGFAIDQPQLNAEANIDIINGPLMQFSTVRSIGKWKLGGEASLNTHLEDNMGPEITGFNVGFGYEGNGWDISSRTTDMMENVKLSYLHHVSPKFTFGAQVDYHLKYSAQKLTVGTKFLADDDRSEIKTKFDSTALVAGCFVHKLSDYTKLKVSAEFNAHDWSVNTQKFGIGLSFE